MKYRKLVVFAAVLAAFACVVQLPPPLQAEAAEASRFERSYRGLQPDDVGGTRVDNPGRGFRLAATFNAVDLSHPWNGGGAQDIREVLRDQEKVHGEKTSVARLHFYLREFAGGPECKEALATCTIDITPEALENIKLTLSRLREVNYQAVLQFAYDDGKRDGRCYTAQTIARHISQLSPIVKEYADVVQSWQAGFVGNWGEWGPNCMNLQHDPASVNVIMESLLAALPDGVNTGMRYPWLRDMITDPAVRARIGFHNDYFTVGQGPYDFYRPTHESWPRVLETAPAVVTDGEMPWDFQWGEVIPGVPAAKRLQSMHYSTFSVTHNINTTIKAWRETTITEQQVRQENLPVSDGYFRNFIGAPVERTVYDYVRDHLGYRIQLEKARFRRTATSLNVDMGLLNTGFSAPHTTRAVQLVLLDRAGTAVAKTDSGADWTTWQGAAATEPATTGEVGGNGVPPVHKVSGTLDLTKLPKGTYRVGVALSGNGVSASDPDYAVRFANGDVFWDTKSGVNVIGQITVGRGPIGAAT
ncbi:MAG: hypothetical protein QOI21_1413 [Actinomycetota bacterium]|jgi:hypothetical protein|nr:hypothetical protein [Actinomycetota bacterium]